MRELKIIRMLLRLYVRNCEHTLQISPERCEDFVSDGVSISV